MDRKHIVIALLHQCTDDNVKSYKEWLGLSPELARNSSYNTSNVVEWISPNKYNDFLMYKKRAVVENTLPNDTIEISDTESPPIKRELPTGVLEKPFPLHNVINLCDSDSETGAAPIKSEAKLAVIPPAKQHRKTCAPKKINFGEVLGDRHNHDQMRMRRDVTRKAKRQSYREDHHKADDDITEDQRRLAAITTEKKLLAARIKDKKAKKKEMGRIPRHSNSRRTAVSSLLIPQFVQRHQDTGDEISDSKSDSDSEFPKVTSLSDAARRANLPVDESHIPTGPPSSLTLISDAASKFEAPAFAPTTPVSDPYFDVDHMYTDYESNSAIAMGLSEHSASMNCTSDEQLATLLGFPLEDLSHLFGVQVPTSDDCFDTDSYPGTIMPASGGFDFGNFEPGLDMNLFATMFPGLPPTSSSPQQWPLLLPSVPSSPAVTLAPDTPPAPMRPTRRCKHNKVDPKDIILEKRARKVRIRED
ncbi:hypothetical protein K438DRAFT_1971158 [Mycena galopus ATCC 62051]|nr:hypothetical protein K438DRAFT_1971158 [Mycena galopus ATCC 62051]